MEKEKIIKIIKKSILIFSGVFFVILIGTFVSIGISMLFIWMIMQILGIEDTSSHHEKEPVTFAYEQFEKKENTFTYEQFEKKENTVEQAFERIANKYGIALDILSIDFENQKTVEQNGFSAEKNPKEHENISAFIVYQLAENEALVKDPSYCFGCVYSITAMFSFQGGTYVLDESTLSDMEILHPLNVPALREAVLKETFGEDFVETYDD